MKYNRFLLVIIAMIMMNGVFCQNIEKKDTIKMHEIVVSANRQEVEQQMAPALVDILPLKTMQTTNAVCLAQGLAYTTGLRVESNCQNCGFTQVRINGLDGHYAQILIDSRPVFSSLMGVYGLEQIPTEMIDHVEVVRGGGSALFGASAVGGIINIITKEGMRNGGSVSHSFTSIGGTSSFDNTTGITASAATADQRAGIYIFGQGRHRNAYDQ